MAEIPEKVKDELEGLRRLRDELRVQLHLGKAEARERWEALEKRWEHLESRLATLRQESREPIHDIGEAARNLLNEIREGYRHLRDKV